MLLQTLLPCRILYIVFMVVFFSWRKIMITEQKVEILENVPSIRHKIEVETQLRNRSKKDDLYLYKAQEIIGRFADQKNLYSRKKVSQETIRGVEKSELRKGFYEHKKGGVWFLKSNPAKKYIGFFPEKYGETSYHIQDNGWNEILTFSQVLSFHTRLADMRGLQCFNPTKEGFEACKSYAVNVGGWFVKGKRYFQKTFEKADGEIGIEEKDTIPKELLDILRSESEQPEKVEIQIRYINIENVVSLSPIR